MSELPPWPDVEDYCTPSLDKQGEALKYAHALNAALRARLAKMLEFAADELYATESDKEARYIADLISACKEPSP